MASDEARERRATEVELLQSMYPDEVSFAVDMSEMVYSSEGGRLTLRLPFEYPITGYPDVIEARVKGRGGQDLGTKMKEVIKQHVQGVEALDSAIAAFLDLLESAQEGRLGEGETNQASSTNIDSSSTVSKKTIVIWLHHLLNTAKRKQALATSDPLLSGISKPGHPGVMIFSGPASNVDEHVNGLKSLNWQAFQVRLEEDEEWTFEHGRGVAEVETMKDIVREIGDNKKDVFMEAMRMK